MEQRNLINELNKVEEQESSVNNDIVKIEMARHEFKIKNFEKSLAIYKTIEHKNSLKEIDIKLIAYGEGQMGKYEA